VLWWGKGKRRRELGGDAVLMARSAPTSRPLRQELPHHDCSGRRYRRRRREECREDAERISGRDVYETETGPYLLVCTASHIPRTGASNETPTQQSAASTPAPPSRASPAHCTRYTQCATTTTNYPQTSITGHRISRFIRTTVPSDTTISIHEAKPITHCSFPHHIYESKNIYIQKPQ
jgi:hypothetical protein